MLQTIILSLIYSCIASAGTVFLGILTNLAFFRSRKPSQSSVVLSIAVAFLLVIAVGSQTIYVVIGGIGLAIVAVLSMFPFYKTVNI